MTERFVARGCTGWAMPPGESVVRHPHTHRMLEYLLKYVKMNAVHFSRCLTQFDLFLCAYTCASMLFIYGMLRGSP